MLDTSRTINHEAIREKIARVETYWECQPTNAPHTLNGFNGTWNFSDHDLIPHALHNFLLEYFYSRLGESRKNHIAAIPLDEINALMNKTWEGPGSMVKIKNLTQELKAERHKTTPVSSADVLKGYETPTIESNLGDINEE
jgi:hypothetical protein